MPEKKNRKQKNVSDKKRQKATKNAKNPVVALQVIGRPTKQREIKLSWLRKRFVREYELTLGNISETCQRVGIHRGTFYRWMKSTSRINQKFRAALEAVNPTERLLDAAEHVVAAHLAARNLRAAELVLKSAKAKHRGFHEKIEVENTDAMTEELKQVKAAIEARAAAKGVSFESELQYVLSNHKHLFKGEILDKLVSEAVN